MASLKGSVAWQVTWCAKILSPYWWKLSQSKGGIKSTVSKDENVSHSMSHCHKLGVFFDCIIVKEAL